MSKQLKSSLILLLTAMIWGTAFVFQKEGGAIGGFTFNGIRTFLGGLFLIPVIMILNKGKLFEREKKEQNKKVIIAGIIIGVVLFIASSLQQFGLAYTTAGKGAFITTLYVVFVPIINLILGKKVRPIMWICVALGIFGLYLIAMNGESFSIGLGDFLVVLCALAFSIHILTIDKFGKVCITAIDSVKISCIQFLVSGLLGMICMVIFERPITSEEIFSNWFCILYAGLISSGIGYTLQIVGQKNADPAVASLIMSLESVFGAIAGAVMLHEVMTTRELLGCIVIFMAVIISNIPEKKKSRELIK